MNFDVVLWSFTFLFIHLMLFDYSNEFIIPTRVSFSRQEQRGDKVTIQ